MSAGNTVTRDACPYLVARRDASPHRTAVERRLPPDFAKYGGGGREGAPPRWRLSQLVRRRDGGFPCGRAACDWARYFVRERRLNERKNTGTPGDSFSANKSDACLPHVHGMLSQPSVIVN